MADERKTGMGEQSGTAGLLGCVRAALRPLAEGGEIRAVLNSAIETISRASGCESVGIRWKAAEDYPYLVTRGFGRDFVVMEGPLCVRDTAGLVLRRRDGTPQLACMCGAVVQGRIDPTAPFFTDGGSFWTNGTTKLLTDTPPSAVVGIDTRNYCNAVGYESVALIPLRTQGECLGLLQLNSRTPGRFTRDSIEQYERVADIIAEAVAQRPLLNGG